ncbi:unnamed protein product [Amoebophrya sp. A25]|nr:unnamed protein product [Amoebophrya sp. A25]|eukprot:GSA25T00017503001.1
MHAMHTMPFLRQAARLQCSGVTEQEIRVDHPQECRVAGVKASNCAPAVPDEDTTSREVRYQHAAPGDSIEIAARVSVTLQNAACSLSSRSPAAVKPQPGLNLGRKSTRSRMLLRSMATGSPNASSSTPGKGCENPRDRVFEVTLCYAGGVRRVLTVAKLSEGRLRTIASPDLRSRAKRLFGDVWTQKLYPMLKRLPEPEIKHSWGSSQVGENERAGPYAKTSLDTPLVPVRAIFDSDLVAFDKATCQVPRAIRQRPWYRDPRYHIVAEKVEHPLQEATAAEAEENVPSGAALRNGKVVVVEYENEARNSSVNDDPVRDGGETEKAPATYMSIVTSSKKVPVVEHAAELSSVENRQQLAKGMRELIALDKERNIEMNNSNHDIKPEPRSGATFAASNFGTSSASEQSGSGQHQRDVSWISEERPERLCRTGREPSEMKKELVREANFKSSGPSSSLNKDPSFVKTTEARKWHHDDRHDVERARSKIARALLFRLRAEQHPEFERLSKRDRKSTFARVLARRYMERGEPIFDVRSRKRGRLMVQTKQDHVDATINGRSERCGRVGRKTRSVTSVTAQDEKKSNAYYEESKAVHVEQVADGKVHEGAEDHAVAGEALRGKTRTNHASAPRKEASIADSEEERSWSARRFEAEICSRVDIILTKRLERQAQAFESFVTHYFDAPGSRRSVAEENYKEKDEKHIRFVAAKRDSQMTFDDVRSLSNVKMNEKDINISKPGEDSSENASKKSCNKEVSNSRPSPRRKMRRGDPDRRIPLERTYCAPVMRAQLNPSWSVLGRSWLLLTYEQMRHSTRDRMARPKMTSNNTASPTSTTSSAEDAPFAGIEIQFEMPALIQCIVSLGRKFGIFRNPRSSSDMKNNVQKTMNIYKNSNARTASATTSSSSTRNGQSTQEERHTTSEQVTTLHEEILRTLRRERTHSLSVLCLGALLWASTY